MNQALPHFILEVSSSMILLFLATWVIFICVRVGFAGMVPRSLLAVLPNEDRGPGQHAGYQPPCGLEHQEEEKDPGDKCQYASLNHGLFCGRFFVP